MNCATYECGDDRFSGRNFFTIEEKVEKLQEYKKWLDNESKGVDETISKLRKAS